MGTEHIKQVGEQTEQCYRTEQIFFLCCNIVFSAQIVFHALLLRFVTGNLKG